MDNDKFPEDGPLGRKKSENAGLSYLIIIKIDRYYTFGYKKSKKYDIMSSFYNLDYSAKASLSMSRFLAYKF